MREKYVRYDSKKYPIGFNAKRRFQIKPIQAQYFSKALESRNYFYFFEEINCCKKL